MRSLETILAPVLHAAARACTVPGLLLYAGALGLLALGALLIRNTSVGISIGAVEYKKRIKRRPIAIIILCSGGACAGMGLLVQFFFGSFTWVNSPPVGSPAGLPGLVNSSSNPASKPSGNAPVGALLGQALQLLQQKQLDAALDEVNAAILSAPQNPDAYGLRASIYAQKKMWDASTKDFQKALQLDGKNVRTKFNLAEIEFMQKKYADARAGFLALQQDPDLGDLAAYKVFLCDLFGGHEDLAAQELDAFNQVGSNASYYFANAAWSLVHHKTEDARGWLTSAAKIYAPPKFGVYAASLIALGYMPLPAAVQL